MGTSKDLNANVMLQVARPCARGLAGVHFVGTVHDEYQGENSTKTQVFVASVLSSLWLVSIDPFCNTSQGVSHVCICVETQQHEVDFPCHLLESKSLRCRQASTHHVEKKHPYFGQRCFFRKPRRVFEFIRLYRREALKILEEEEILNLTSNMVSLRNFSQFCGRLLKQNSDFLPVRIHFGVCF